jgi:hypothetical protein
MKNLLFGIFFLLFLTNCTVYNYTAGTNFKVQYESNAEKNRLKLGYYIPSQVCNYQIRKDYREQIFTNLNFGQSICFGLEKTLNNLFTETIRLQDTINVSPDINMFLVVDTITGSAIVPNQLEKIRMLLRAKYTVYDKNMNIVWEDTYQGEGIMTWHRNSYWSCFCLPLYFYLKWNQGNKDLESCMRITLEDLFKNTYSGIEASKFWTK